MIRRQTKDCFKSNYRLPQGTAYAVHRGCLLSTNMTFVTRLLATPERMAASDTDAHGTGPASVQPAPRPCRRPLFPQTPRRSHPNVTGSCTQHRLFKNPQRVSTGHQISAEHGARAATMQ